MSEISDREIEDLSGEEFARRGNQLFEERVLPHIEDPEADARKFVAIDIATGDYEIGTDDAQTTRRLLKRNPEAMGRTWLRRVGSETAYRAGIRFRSDDAERL
jgi:hypothetical protein